MTWKSKASIVFAGVLGGAAVSAPAAAAPPVPTEIRVICPDLGQVTVAAPPRLGEQDAAPADGQVRVSVGYAAIDDRTGGAVAADPTWPGTGAIDCGTVPFAGKPAADVAAAPLPVGVRSGDRLTGRYQVSVRLTLSPPAQPSGPMTAAAAVPFPNDGALSRYLGSRTGMESVALFDGTSGITYAFSPQTRYYTASIIKVAILATLLRRAQDQGRGLTPTERTLAERMIEVSDNAAATSLWNEVGGGPGVARFAAKVGMTGTAFRSDGYWGLTLTTAPDQVLLLRVIAYPNPLLTPSSRSYAQFLMSHVVASQAWGVPAGAPAGALTYVKNGWLPYLGTNWVLNSIGGAEGGGHNYVTAELTYLAPSMSYGITTIETAARMVTSPLPRTAIGDH